MNDWFTSFNRAVGWEEDPADAQNKQLSIQEQAQRDQLALMRDEIARNEPFLRSGYLGNAMLQGMLTGKPSQYMDPAYKEFSDRNELARLNWEALQKDRSLATEGLWQDIARGENPIDRTLRESSSRMPYDYNAKWYKGPNGELTKTPPMLTFDPNLDGGLSPAGQYQQKIGNLALMRGLGARGQAGSGYAPFKQGMLGSAVAADDYNNKWGRILDAVKIGTGASAAAGGASQSGMNALGQGAGLGVGILGQGAQARQSLYSGRQAGAMNAANIGLNAWKAFGGGGGDGSMSNADWNKGLDSSWQGEGGYDWGNDYEGL